jgi:WD40 repeat protein
LRIYRDATSLAVTSELWPTIKAALAATRHFILLASPDAARSRWVKQEIAWWLAHRSAKTIFVVVTDGALSWSEPDGDFDWQQTTAIPENLKGAFSSEPLWVDLRWATTAPRMSTSDLQFQDAVASLAAPMRGVSKDSLFGEDLRQQRRSVRHAVIAAMMLAVLSLSLIVAGVFAYGQYNEAVSRQLAASSVGQLSTDPELGLLLALQAVQRDTTEEAGEALREALIASRVRAPFQGHTAEVVHVEFSRDGAQLLSASEDGTARIWAVATQHEVRSIVGSVTQRESIDCLDRCSELRVGLTTAALDPTGQRILTHSRDGRTRLWDASNGSVLRQFATAPSDNQFGEPALRGAAFSPTGDRIVTNGSDTTARIWDALTGAELLTLSGHKGMVVTARFSPDGLRVVTASRDGSARIWDAKTGKTLTRFDGHADTTPGVVAFPTAAAFSPDGTQVATSGYDGTVRIWSASDGHEIRVLRGHSSRVLSVEFSPNGRWVLSTGRDDTARVWDVASGDQVVTLHGHTPTGLEDATFSPDGKMIVTAGSDGSVRPWDVGELDPVGLEGHQGTVWSAEFRSDDARVVTASADGSARVWNPASGAELMKLPIFEPIPNSKIPPLALATFSPDGQRLVSSAFPARVWNATSGESLLTLMPQPPRPPDALTFSNDGQLIATAADSVVQVYAADSGRERLRLVHPQAINVWDARFSSDGTEIVTAASDGVARIWDVGSGHEVADLRSGGDLFTARFSPDGRYLVTGGSDGSAHMWQIASSTEKYIIRGHTATVMQAQFSRDGTWLVTAAEDGTARVWYADSGRPLMTLRNPNWLVSSATFSSDNRLVLTANGQSALLFRCEVCRPVDELVELARSRVTRQLTPEEVEHFHVDALRNPLVGNVSR